MYAPSVVGSVTSFEVELPTVEAMAGRIASTVERLPWLVFERDGAILGYAYASPHRARAAYAWSVETSVFVDATVHHAGVGRALYTELLGVLADLGYVSAYAGVTLPNPASIGLHHALGFRDVGVFEKVGFKDGAWRDVIWMRRELTDPPEHPSPPRPWRP